MIEFPINVYQQPCDKKAYASSFHSPVAFFLSDKTDPWSVLVAFALCDFQRGRITYIVSASPENVRKLAALTAASSVQGLSPLPRGEFRQVHSVIEIVPDESFYAFVYASSSCGYFYHVDYKRKFLRLITADDFQALAGCGPVDSFGSTFAKDPQDPDSFYLNAKLAASGSPASYAVAYYRVALDLGSAKHLCTRPAARTSRPRTPRGGTETTCSVPSSTRRGTNC